MFIVINGFIPKDNNLLGNGGRSVKVSCIPVGKYEPASKNSYKRVYDDFGNFTYPSIEENILKKKESYIGIIKHYAELLKQKTHNFH